MKDVLDKIWLIGMFHSNEENDNLLAFYLLQFFANKKHTCKIARKFWSRVRVLGTIGFNTRHLIYYKFTKLIV